MEQFYLFQSTFSSAGLFVPKRFQWCMEPSVDYTKKSENGQYYFHNGQHYFHNVDFLLKNVNITKIMLTIILTIYLKNIPIISVVSSKFGAHSV